MINVKIKRILMPLRAFYKPIINLKILFIILSLSACQKELDETPVPIVPDNTAPVNVNLDGNNWILENMKLYYFWNNQIPENSDKSIGPKPFFESLLYKFNEFTRPDGDRFSFMVEDAKELEASLNGQEQSTGAEFTFYLSGEGPEDVIAQVLYVLPGSPAESAGLKRGDIIYQVNGQKMNKKNYYSLLYDQDSFVFGMAGWKNNQIVNANKTIRVNTEILQENPVYLDSIYSIGSNKIGYLVYNQFIPAPNGNNMGTYDRQIDQIFNSFKESGINELVLDLRYNPGGYVSSATNMASLIGKGIDENKVFYKQEWNTFLAKELEKEYGEDFFVEKFIKKSHNIGDQLNRVYVLTSKQTASASEIIINGLRPYMDVVIIGTTTVGKNVGSITLKDETGKIKYGLQPIVFKSYNSLGQSDYTAGFTPDIEAKENMELKALGDVEETLLNVALSQISGAPLARKGAPEDTLPFAGSSINRKAGGSNMFDDKFNGL